MCVCFCIKVSGMQKVCAFYIVISGLSGCANFSALSHKWHDLKKKKYWTYFLPPLYNFCGNISHSKNNSPRYSQKCSNACMLSHCSSCQILLKLEFSWQIFEVFPDTKFRYNLPLGAKLYNAVSQSWQSFSQFNNFADSPDWDYDKPWMMKQVFHNV